ncbi:putative hydrolase C777.06c isoform X3 [Prunus avium]|uniref:Hydrolase C777.06c isoform X3 n=1 Tax=Prunus avium TaxID=42229 RepID=A0A6P5SM93_PRUAV|nr:putative hydrolase C777.06c isoform X3 [Prunus avium]
MVQCLGTIRPSPSLSYFATYKRQLSFRSSPITAPANGFSPFRRIFNAYLQSNSATTSAGSRSPSEPSEVIFIGTGTSEGIPRVSCLTNPLKTCEVCSKAAEPGFSTTVLYNGFLPMGLDDLRDWTNNVQPHIPIYVAQRDFEVMKKTHYYLVDTSFVLAGAAVSELQFNIIHEDPFSVQGLQFTPLPVWHGRGYRSLGFRFGNVCYISDVSDIPEETYPLLKNCELLILDALRPDRSTATHFGLPRALEEVRKIQPKRTLFTGMMHLMDHERVSDYLMKLMETEGLDVQLSYDGLRVPVAF